MKDPKDTIEQQRRDSIERQRQERENLEKFQADQRRAEQAARDESVQRATYEAKYSTALKKAKANSTDRVETFLGFLPGIGQKAYTPMRPTKRFQAYVRWVTAHAHICGSLPVRELAQIVDGTTSSPRQSTINDLEAKLRSWCSALVAKNIFVAYEDGFVAMYLSAEAIKNRFIEQDRRRAAAKMCKMNKHIEGCRKAPGLTAAIRAELDNLEDKANATLKLLGPATGL